MTEGNPTSKEHGKIAKMLKINRVNIIAIGVDKKNQKLIKEIASFGMSYTIDNIEAVNKIIKEMITPKKIDIDNNEDVADLIESEYFVDIRCEFKDAPVAIGENIKLEVFIENKGDKPTPNDSILVIEAGAYFERKKNSNWRNLLTCDFYNQRIHFKNNSKFIH